MGCCFSVLFCQLFRVLFFSSAALLLNQHPRQNNTRRDSRKRRKQRPFERISGLRHLSRQKINRHRIEDRLRTAHHDRSSQANQGIRPMIFKDIQYQSRGRGGGKHFNKHKRHQFRRKAHPGRSPGKKPAHEIQKAGRAQHPHRHHKPDQRRHDLDDRVKPILRSLDKILIHITSGRQPVSHNIKNNDRNDDIRYIR